MCSIFIGQAKSSFTFDFVQTGGDQEGLFRATLEPLIPLVVDGYDLTVMAYGQAGSGKTHALFGPGPNDPTTSVAQLGLLPRFVRALLDTGPLRTKVSYVEVRLYLICALFHYVRMANVHIFTDFLSTL